MHITRRSFGKSVAATGAALAAPWPLSAAVPEERLILSAPLTHSDWMLKPGMVWGIDGVKHMLDACKASGWSHVYWRVYDAGRANYPSKLTTSNDIADEDNYYNPQTDADRALRDRLTPGITPELSAEYLAKLAKIDYAAFDSLAAAIDYGHKIGLKIHAWASINEDDHGWGWSSDFTKAHPEFRWMHRDGRPYRSQLSFAFPEVREYKLALVEELLAYDIDGLFLDWIRTGDIRDDPQTDAAGVAESGYEQPNIDAFKAQFGVDPHDVANDDERWVRVRAEPKTLYMRELRKLVDAQAAPVPISVMVGHPWHYRGMQDPIDGNLRGLLMDVATWAQEGLMDAAIAAGYYRAGGNAENAYRALAEETGGKVDLWYYAWVPSSPEEFNKDFEVARALDAKRMLFWEADYIDSRPNAAALKTAMSAKAAW